jgi:VCBS repeat-containing protein
VFREHRGVPGEGIVVGYDQMPAAAPLEVIGKIQTASGSVTALRADGVLVRPSVGALVYQGDTIETGADGAVSITFIDGTAFNLSATTRLVLNEFSCERTGTPNSALFSLVQGAFSFVAGKVARTGGLNIDTPFATIRGTAQDRGIGVLTLAAFTFAAIKESEAASRHDAFLDDGTITYKDLAHGTFEIVTRDGRVIIADDPGETIVVDPAGSVARIPNSASRMAELQQAQQSALATLSLGQQGAAPGGSSTPQFDIPLQLQPINFAQPSNGPASEAVTTTHVTPVSSGFIEVPQLNPPPVPVLAPDAGLHTIIEIDNATGSTGLHITHAGTLTFADFRLTTVSASVASITWSGGATSPSGLAGVLAGALSITTESNLDSGSIVATFNAADFNFDFLATNETLTVVYNVTITDNRGVSLTRPVAITITGTNDAPVLAADASGPHTVTEGLNTTGTLTFTDVDLNDHHTVSTSVASAIWSGGATLPSGLAEVLAGALSTTASDSTDSGIGAITFTFRPGDTAFDFLAASQTLTITYAVTVTDNNGVSSAQLVTITITGTNDAPVATITPTTYSATEQVSLNLKNSGMSVSDVDSLGGVETATLSVTEGTLTVTAGTSGATVQGSGTNTVTITGTLAQINALLNTDSTSTVSYMGASDMPSASTTLTLSVNDNGLGGGAALTGSDTAIINIGSVNDAPELDAHSGSLSYTENQAATAVDTAITVSDVDSANLAGATVQITGNFVSGQDVLGFTNQNGIAGSYNAATGVLTLTGQASVAQYQAALRSVTYFNSSDNPSSQTRMISYQVNDGSAQNNLSNAVTAMVAITPVNDAPAITSGAAAARVSEEGLTNGVPDTLPAGFDTTNSPTANGTITTSDADGDPLTMILGVPSVPLISGGVTIAWTLQDVGHTLIGKAGAATIITATITDAGAYTVTLSGPIDHSTANQEDNKTFTVPVTVSDGHTTTPTTLSVTIEDDSPNVEQVEVSVVPPDSNTIPPVTGSVLTGAGDATSNSFGADGGFVQSITVGGGTYNFNPAGNGGVSTSGFGGFTYDGTTKTLAVGTDTNDVGGGVFAMVMTTGAFTFQPPTDFSSESVGFVLVDGDGDTASSVLHFSLGASSVTHASGNVTLTDDGDVTIDRSQTGTMLTGTGFGEILIGRDGSNNTINANEGNDVLIGGTGNDTLSGGAGDDMMTEGVGVDTFIINSSQSPGTVGGSGDAGTISSYDVITDFATATAAGHSSPNNTARAALAPSDDSTVPAAGDINDQFHFAYTNRGTLDSPQLLSQAVSHAGAEIPLVLVNSVISLPNNFNSPALPIPADNLAPQGAKNASLLSGTGSRDDLFQILDDILTGAAQAPLDTVTALDQNHVVAWMNAHHDKPSSDFIIHA